MHQSRLELLGSAAAGVAHDLNNQFTLILNHIEMADVNSARDAVSRCASLTSGLLALCRGESAALRPLDLARIVRIAAASFPLPPGVEVSLNASADGCPTLGNEIAIERALDNLFRNACAAMKDKGNIRITVSGPHIEVTDSGPGIPPEHMGRIFEPFFTTGGTAGGTGLGLAIVRDIMRQHGGSVTVQSNPGEGARFGLHFRCATDVE